MGGGRWFFVKKFEKKEVKHETLLMWNGVKSFWGKPFDFCHVHFFLGQSLFRPCFWKNREEAYFFPISEGEGGGHSWPEYLPTVRITDGVIWYNTIKIFCLRFKYNDVLLYFVNYDSLHAKLNSHYKAWSCTKKKHKKIKAYRKSV